MKKYFILAAAALTFAACSNYDETASTAEGNVAIEVNAAINGTLTRASGTEWAANDQIGISTVEGTGTAYSNVPYMYNGSQFVANTAPIYFQTEEVVTFYAYYPYTAGATYSGVSTAADMQTDAVQPTIDFLFASGATASKDNPTVSFTGDYAFTHRMSRIVVQFTEGDDVDLDNLLTAYTLSGLTMTGSFDTATGVAAGDETSTADLAMSLSGVATTGGTYSASPLIVFPQSATTIGLAVTVDGQTYNASLTVPSVTSDTETLTGLQSGYSYLFPVTVNKTGLEVGAAEIVDWDTVEAGGVSATM